MREGRRRARKEKGITNVPSTTKKATAGQLVIAVLFLVAIF